MDTAGFVAAARAESHEIDMSDRDSARMLLCCAASAAKALLDEKDIVIYFTCLRLSAIVLALYPAITPEDVEAEWDRARAKHPSAECSGLALMEEVGELAAEMGIDEAAAIVEARQVIVVAAKLAMMGDPSTDRYRWANGLLTFRGFAHGQD